MSIKPPGLSPNTSAPPTTGGTKSNGLSGANVSQTQSLNGKPAQSDQKSGDSSGEITEGQINAMRFSTPGRSISQEAAKASGKATDPSAAPPGGNINKPFAPLDSTKMGLEGLASIGKGIGEMFGALAKASQQNQQKDTGAEAQQAAAQQPPPPPPPPPAVG